MWSLLAGLNQIAIVSTLLPAVNAYLQGLNTQLR